MTGHVEDRHREAARAALRMPPVATRYVAGRWHRDRVSATGYAQEARVLLKGLVRPKADNRRFLIVARARSGTTLLKSLLDGHSRIQCDGEMLKNAMVAPLAHLERLADKSEAEVYGAKWLSYQMVQVHRLEAPWTVARRLRERRFALIHLTRDTFAQTVSIAAAQARRFYHDDGRGAVPEGRIRPDPANFVARIAWAEALLAYERAFFAEVEPIAVSYERDLADPEGRRRLLDRLCAVFGVPPEPLETTLRKVLPSRPQDILDNYGAIADAMRAAGQGHLLPDAPERGAAP